MSETGSKLVLVTFPEEGESEVRKCPESFCLTSPKIDKIKKA